VHQRTSSQPDHHVFRSGRLCYEAKATWERNNTAAYVRVLALPRPSLPWPAGSPACSTDLFTTNSRKLTEEPNTMRLSLASSRSDRQKRASKIGSLSGRPRETVMQGVRKFRIEEFPLVRGCMDNRERQGDVIAISEDSVQFASPTRCRSSNDQSQSDLAPRSRP